MSMVPVQNLSNGLYGHLMTIRPGTGVKTFRFRTISGYTGSSKDPESSVWMVPEWLSSRPYFFR